MIAIMDGRMDYSSASGIRASNERAIIASIRLNGMMTKPEIADRLGLTRQAVNVIVSQMIAEGVLRASGRKTGGVGRSSTYYALDPAAAFSIGLLIGHDRIELMLVDFLGAAHFRVRAALPQSGEQPSAAVLESTASAARRHCRDAGIEWRRIAGLGVLHDGPAAHAAAQGSGQARGGDLQARLESAFQLPITVARRAAASALAEQIKAEGALPGCFAFVCSEHEVAGALMIAGEVHGGEHKGAMQLGGFPLGAGPDGSIVRLADIASAKVLRLRLAAAGAPTDDLYAANASSPQVVAAWIAEAGAALGAAFAFVHLAVDLGALVIDCGLPGALAQRLLEAAGAAMSAALPAGHAAPQLSATRLGNDAAVFGAAALSLHSRFAPQASGPEARPQQQLSKSAANRVSY
jgi:predicted NBD/HSP70 family sugar kinase